MEEGVADHFVITTTLMGRPLANHAPFVDVDFRIWRGNAHVKRNFLKADGSESRGSAHWTHGDSQKIQVKLVSQVDFKTDVRCPGG